MAIYFTYPICNGSDRIHNSPPPPRLRPKPHPGMNLGTYNIWYGRGFELPQAIWDVQLGNYELMLLTDTKIMYKAY